MKNFNFSLAVFIVVLLLVSCSESKKIEIVDNNDSSNQSGEKNDSDDSDSATDTTQDNGDSQHEGRDSSDSVDDSGDTLPDNGDLSDPIDDTDSSDPNDSDTTDSTTEKDSCENNPCERIPNSTGVCIPKGTSNYTCKCKENYTWNGSLCTADSKVASCTGLPENAQWNSVSTITQTWNGSDWVPSSTGTFNEITSTIDCRYKCNEHYTWKNSSCAADNRTANCIGLPDNAIWNSVSDITQTWNGFEWSPSTTGTYNDEASSEYCRYKCKEHYTWTNSICKAEQQVKNCTEIPANAEWNTVSTITQTWNGTSWAPSTNTTYNESGSTSECRFKCAENYTYENSQCVGAKRTKPCDGLPKNAVWNTAESIEQTWDGYDWTPSNIGVYNTTSSTNVCRYKCNEYCKWEESRCVCPCDIEPCASVENSTGNCTATDWDEYSCKCEAGYFWNDSECKKTYTLGNICTGQNKCYNNKSEIIDCPAESEDFFGQDAQYAELGTCFPQRFKVETISGDDVVIDLNTGLTWEISPSSDTNTWNEALNHCNDLNTSNYGRNSNWRVPNPLELLTIVDNSTYNPATNSNFTNMPTDDSTYFWTSKEYKGHTSYAYIFNPYYGWYLVEVHNVYLKSNPYKVLCVSGDEIQPATSADFTSETISGSVVVTDSRTGLMWQQKYVTKKTWQQALKYCEDSTYAGYDDWRLPNKNELASLINYEKSNYPYSYFSGKYFWSSSTTSDLSNRAWYMNFELGGVYHNNKSATPDVRCVRSAALEHIEEEGCEALGGNWNGSTCTQTQPCLTKPENTVWNDDGANGTYTQNWSSSGWTPASYSYDSIYSTTSGVCHYTCDSTHTWENNSCINQKTVSCSSKPTNTIWNDNGLGGLYNQNWSSSSGWTPNYTSSYSTTAGTCRYKCASGYDWNGTSCTKYGLPECSSSSGTPCYDSKSGLIWSAKASYKMSRSDAKSYCENLSQGGYYWRLPNINELNTLLNCSTSFPVNSGCLSFSCANRWDYDCDPKGKFEDTDAFWSSSYVSDDLNYGWYVDFGCGEVSDYYHTMKFSVRCVISFTK